MDIATFQRKIGLIEGVEAARVVAGNGVIDEVHVLARRERAPKQLVRDVQTLSQALFGVGIDRRVVSVVQLSDADLETGLRPALVDVTEMHDGSRAEVDVTLRWEDRLLVGRASGAAAAITRNRLIAEATLEAVRQGIDKATATAIDSVDVATLGGRKVAVALVVLVSEGAERILIGAAIVEKDESRAVVRAVLDALNRLLPDLRTA